MIGGVELMEMKGAAMSELEKAKQIAAEAFNFKSKAYTTIEQQNEIIEVNRKAFMQILSLSSLTIPKSIADELDSDFSDIDATDIGYVLEQTSPYGSRAFVNYYFKNKNIIALYLAGKALGVDLVKVV